MKAFYYPLLLKQLLVKMPVGLASRWHNITTIGDFSLTNNSQLTIGSAGLTNKLVSKITKVWSLNNNCTAITPSVLSK